MSEIQGRGHKSEQSVFMKRETVEPGCTEREEPGALMHTAGSVPVLGVTGGVGAGKSTVLGCLRDRYGAYILEADEIGRRIQQPGGICYARMLELFGSEALLPDGSFDRGRVAEAVFGDRSLLERLNAIIHPAVKAQILTEISREQEKQEARLLVVEAALFFEEHYETFCDSVWYIYADEKARIARLTHARGYSEEKARKIMANQMHDEEFRARCDAVIDNSGRPEQTFAQVSALCSGLFLGERQTPI